MRCVATISGEMTTLVASITDACVPRTVDASMLFTPTIVAGCAALLASRSTAIIVVATPPWTSASSSSPRTSSTSSSRGEDPGLRCNCVCIRTRLVEYCNGLQNFLHAFGFDACCCQAINHRIKVTGENMKHAPGNHVIRQSDSWHHAETLLVLEHIIAQALHGSSCAVPCEGLQLTDYFRLFRWRCSPVHLY